MMKKQLDVGSTRALDNTDAAGGDTLLNEKDGTVNDVQDMRRMGKIQ